MRTRHIYKEYLKEMEEMFVDLDDKHYINLIPKTRVTIVDGKEVTEKYLNVSIVDDTIVHEIKFEVTLKELSEHIHIVQDLAKQLKDNKLNT